MRVLHVAQALSRRFGGVQTVVLDLSHFQAQAGMEVEVATTNADSPTGSGVLDVATDQPMEAAGVRVHYFPVHLRAMLYSRPLQAFLDREMHRFDIVHVHGMYRFPMTYAAYRARRSRIPYVLSPHGCLDPYLYHKSSRSLALKRVYERWLELPNLHGAGGIHFTSREERERVAFLGLRTPSCVVPNGIDWRRYATLPPRGTLRATYGLGDAPIILFLGRLHLKKGLDLLVEAFAKVREKHPTARLVVAGEADHKFAEKVRRWVRKRGLENRVLFLGHLEGDSVIQAYVDADVFALTSYTENFGMTVVEAMVCGLPVVISDQVNIHTEVATAGAGLVTRCDADEAAAALDMLLADADRRRTMATKARAAVKAMYDWPTIVDAFSSEYRNIISRTIRTQNPHGTDRLSIHR